MRLVPPGPYPRATGLTTILPLALGLLQAEGAIRRKPVDLAQYNPVKESLIDERSLPLVMEPASDQVELSDWIANNRDHVEERIVTTGEPVGDLIEVTKGLKAGEPVATKNVAQLADGIKVS